MSQPLFAVANRLAEAGSAVAWQQWGAIGATTNTDRPHHQAAIDPEALLLFSLALLEQERRLADVVASWVATNSGLLSVQRVRNLSASFPSTVRDRLSGVAREAIDHGKDKRWASLVSRSHHLELDPRRGKLRSRTPQFANTAELMLQLRQGIGVGVKADVLAFLLTSDWNGRAWASISTIASALGYTVAAVRRNADDLAAARLIQRPESVDPEAPSSRTYQAARDTWAATLHLNIIQAGWRYWWDRFAYVANVLERSQELERNKASEFAIGVACRELVEKHRQALLRRTGFQVGPIDDDADWQMVLVGGSDTLIEWMRSNP